MKIFVGLDWSKNKHDVHVLNAKGATLGQFKVAHGRAGFNELLGRLRRHKVAPANCHIGIETASNSIVEFLLTGGFMLYILPPNRIQDARGTHRASRAHDDSFDAAVIAELLLTKPKQFILWRPDSLRLQQIRLLLSWLNDLTQARVQQHNRLHALLYNHYPQLANTFANLDGQVALAVIERYPTPTALKQLTRSALEALCREQRFYGKQQIAAYWTALQQPQPKTAMSETAILAQTVSHLAEQLSLLKQQKQATVQELTALFEEHEDGYIFRSLPGAGSLLAPGLLAIFGEDRQRWPSSEMLAAVSGTAPVTNQSGRWRSVQFRRACNRNYRHIWQLFARSSCRRSDWAADYFQAALARGHHVSQAYRMLANRWVRVIWTLWQRGIPYDEEVHLSQLQKHRQPAQ